MDEVVSVIRGQVKRWRIDRQNAYNLYCVWCPEPVPIYNYTPLPFDNELIDAENSEVNNKVKQLETIDWYNNASKELANFSWPTKASQN